MTGGRGHQLGSQSRVPGLPGRVDIGDDDMVGRTERAVEQIEKGAGAAVGVRLIDGPDGAVGIGRARGLEGALHLGGVMGVVVDDDDARGLPLEFEPAGRAPIADQVRDGFLIGQARLAHGQQRGHAVQHIVHALDAQLHGPGALGRDEQIAHACGRHLDVLRPGICALEAAIAQALRQPALTLPGAQGGIIPAVDHPAIRPHLGQQPSKRILIRGPGGEEIGVIPIQVGDDQPPGP